jgi:hypothetical protein
MPVSVVNRFVWIGAVRTTCVSGWLIDRVTESINIASKGHPLTQVVLTKRIAPEIRDLESDPKNYTDWQNLATGLRAANDQFVIVASESDTDKLCVISRAGRSKCKLSCFAIALLDVRGRSRNDLATFHY